MLRRYLENFPLAFRFKIRFPWLIRGLFNCSRFVDGILISSFCLLTHPVPSTSVMLWRIDVVWEVEFVLASLRKTYSNLLRAPTAWCTLRRASKQKADLVHCCLQSWWFSTLQHLQADVCISQVRKGNLSKASQLHWSTYITHRFVSISLSIVIQTE